MDPAEVQLVVSARLGYSLNPGKNFKKFDSESDLDVAIINSDIFEQSWTELRRLFEEGNFHGMKGRLRKLVFE
ncbi:hypothetical protein KC220_23825, partial [Mycobacterium tuberculosis]|nr:hypothetical protein [Mycobacterium tuberculosis]